MLQPRKMKAFLLIGLTGLLLTVLTVLLGLGISVLLREQLTGDEIVFTFWASAMGAVIPDREQGQRPRRPEYILWPAA